MLPQNAKHVNCQDRPGADGVCDNWWIDETTNDSYALFKLDDMTKNFHDLMKTMFENGWNSGEELFLGSTNCAPWEGPTSWPFPAIDPNTLKSSCFSNLRLCVWSQYNHRLPKDGNEFVTGMCTFAWPNLCINGQGYFVNGSVNTSSYSTYRTDQIVDSTTGPYPGTGFASLNMDSSGGTTINFTSNLPVYASNDPSLLAYNSLYDVYNNRIEVLQQQAAAADSKQCQTYPSNGKRPGWGGAGYHQTLDTECDIYPASYLGPGLWLDTESC